MTDGDMTADEELVAFAGTGRWYELALISYFKRILQQDQKMSVADRLSTLEGLGKLAPSAAALAAVAPAGDIAAEIIETALRLDLDSDGNGTASHAVLTRWDVFWNLLRLEPSLMTAIRLMGRH